MAQVVSLSRFDAAAYALIGKHRQRSPERVRDELIALAKAAKLDGMREELQRRDVDQVAQRAPTWIAKMRRRVVQASAEPKTAPSNARTTTLGGSRVLHAAREPWKTIRIALRYDPSLVASELFDARKDDLFRVHPVRDPHDFFAALSAQICELITFRSVTKHRPKNLADVDRRIAHVVRNVGQTMNDIAPQTTEVLRVLSKRLAQWPELEQITRAVSEVSAKRLPTAEVDAVRNGVSSIPRVEHAVIVGAGPAGLAAAIELASRGIKVDLVDARDPWHYTRPVQMVVKQHGVDQMKHLGILEAMKPHLSAITHDLEENPETWRSDPVTGGRPADANRTTRSGEIFAGSRSLYSTTLNSIEQALFRRALELGVRPISNATIGFGKVRGSGPSARRSVWYQRGEAQGPRFTPHGRKHPLGTPDLVLIAEGSRSQRRRSFRVAWDKDERPRKRGLAGLVRVDIGSKVHTWSESASEAKNVVISVGHATTGATWTLVEVPASQRIKNKEDAARYFLQRTSQALDVPLTRKDLVFGGNALFNIENRSVRRAIFSVSERQIVGAIGDSKGIGSPMVGLGMQYGISVDALSVGRLVDNIEHFGFKQASAVFNATTRDNLTAWHKRWV